MAPKERKKQIKTLARQETRRSTSDLQKISKHYNVGPHRANETRALAHSYYCTNARTALESYTAGIPSQVASIRFEGSSPPPPCPCPHS